MTLVASCARIEFSKSESDAASASDGGLADGSSTAGACESPSAGASWCGDQRARGQGQPGTVYCADFDGTSTPQDFAAGSGNTQIQEEGGCFGGALLTRTVETATTRQASNVTQTLGGQTQSVDCTFSLALDAPPSGSNLTTSSFVEALTFDSPVGSLDVRIFTDGRLAATQYIRGGALQEFPMQQPYPRAGWRRVRLTVDYARQRLYMEVNGIAVVSEARIALSPGSVSIALGALTVPAGQAWFVRFDELVCRVQP